MTALRRGNILNGIFVEDAMADPDRFSIPVIEFITKLMREQFPDLNVSRGSAFHKTFIRPAAALVQPFRDRSNTFKRNQNLDNYQVMSEEEMDRRAASFVVDRSSGKRAFGTQRVFFDTIQPVYIDRYAVFFDDNDRRWHPMDGTVLTEIEMASNYIPQTGEYYADVVVISEAEGEDYVAEAGQVNQFSNIAGATRTINPNPYSGGLNRETNTDLYVKIRQAITNRDLVKKDAIATAIKDAFDSVRAVQVIGLGDPRMTRDVVEAVVSIDDVLRFSYCRKVNLPLDENGEVNWFDKNGNPVISPLGGYVGAIADLTGIDFHKVPMSSDRETTSFVSVQPGYRARVYPGYDQDPDPGDYTVTRVESVPVVINGENVKILRLDRPFGDSQISSWDPVADFDKYSYSILGAVQTKSFHVGGKIDAYVDSTADVQDNVIVSILPEVSPGVSEIEVTDTNPVNPLTGLPIFENAKPFRFPVLSILKIEQVDYEDDSVVERELIPEVNWVYVSAESRGRFTRADTDILIIKGFEEDGVTPAFTNKRIKIHYVTNPDIPLIQDWVNDRSRYDVSKDILIRPKNIAVLDVEGEFEGSLDLDVAQQVVQQYILSLGFAGTASSDDITTLLKLYGATKVYQPIQLRLRRDLGNGLSESDVSEDSLTANDTEVFYPASPLSISKVG